MNYRIDLKQFYSILRMCNNMYQLHTSIVSDETTRHYSSLLDAPDPLKEMLVFCDCDQRMTTFNG